MAMGGSAPADGDGMSTREHWDECPSVFDLRWNVRVVGCRGDPSRQTGELSGKPSMQEGMIEGDGGSALTVAMLYQRENAGMNVPVFLI